MKNCILASTSTVHGSAYLAYIIDELAILFKGVDEVLFIPYARPSGISHDEYTAIAAKAFEKIGIKTIGLHTFDDPKTAIANAKGIFTGGGNTFLLVNQLYQLELLTPLKERILNGTPYLGSSAGINICGLTMQNTNDMPIIYPPSFKTLGIVPFNLNAHYLDPDLNSTHKGETRETRIKEYHEYNTTPVVGLREGSWLRITEKEILLKGNLDARIFKQNKTPYEIKSGSFLSDLN